MISRNSSGAFREWLFRGISLQVARLRRLGAFPLRGGRCFRAEQFLTPCWQQMKRAGAGACLWLRGMAHSSCAQIWGPILVRAIGAVSVLSLVAYLGHVSRDFERYGAVRMADEHVARWLEATEGRGQSVPQLSAPLAREQGTARAASAIAASNQENAVESVKPDASSNGGCPEESAGHPAGVTADGKVILNVAGVTELTTLPGIGPARAQAIVALRERLGRFRKVSDLLRIKGIGYKSLQKLKDKVVLDTPIEEGPAKGEVDADGNGQPGAAKDDGVPTERQPRVVQLRVLNNAYEVGKSFRTVVGSLQ